jgi:hypothetical protein
VPMHCIKSQFLASMLTLQSAFWYVKLVSLTLAKVLQIVAWATLYKLE